MPTPAHDATATLPVRGNGEKTLVMSKIFASSELEADSVIKEYLITATDRKNYKTKI